MFFSSFMSFAFYFILLPFLGKIKIKNKIFIQKRKTEITLEGVRFGSTFEQV